MLHSVVGRRMFTFRIHLMFVVSQRHFSLLDAPKKWKKKCIHFQNEVESLSLLLMMMLLLVVVVVSSFAYVPLFFAMNNGQFSSIHSPFMFDVNRHSKLYFNCSYLFVDICSFCYCLLFRTFTWTLHHRHAHAHAHTLTSPLCQFYFDFWTFSHTQMIVNHTLNSSNRFEYNENVLLYCFSLALSPLSFTNNFSSIASTLNNKFGN